METKTVKAVEQFVNVAKRYLVWANSWSGTPEENALTALRFVPELYLAAMALPNIFPDKPGKDQDVIRNHARWQSLRQKFESLPLDGYLKIFSPLKKEDEPVLCSLADDLADIYLDLDRGLSHFENGNIEEAVYEWRFGFWNHWGRHLTGALSALHAFHSFDY